MLEEFLKPILQEEGPNDMLFRLPHFRTEVQVFLGERFPGKWICRGEPTAWPPLAADLRPIEFLFWGYIKDAVNVPSLSTALQELAGWVRGAMVVFAATMLTDVRTELECRYICCATHSDVSQHL
jgi:hypothetical protein